MRQLHVKPIPLELWNYGIRYMSGGLRAMNREYVRYHLLPKGEASITKQGISFDGRYYSCEHILRNKLFLILILSLVMLLLFMLVRQPIQCQ